MAPAKHGQVVPDELADRFASAHTADPYRNYGPSMHDVLKAIGDGEPWLAGTAAQLRSGTKYLVRALITSAPRGLEPQPADQGSAAIMPANPQRSP
jgi:hypothetical protein